MQDIRATDIYEWYNEAYKKASGGIKSSPYVASTKLLEEVVEVLFAAGFSTQKILDVCHSAINKEMMKVRKSHSLQGRTFIDELVDVGIVLKSLVGSPEIYPQYCVTEAGKMQTNKYYRIWIVNEHGSLSHVKEISEDRRKAVQHHWQGEERRR